MKDLTAVIKEALEGGSCRIVPKSSVFLTDRPENRGKKGFKDDRGNSDVEAGHAFDVTALVKALAASVGHIFVSLNNIRIFGPISDKNVLHYHGYSHEELKKSPGAFHCIILTVHAVGRYQAENGSVAFARSIDGTDGKGIAELVLFHEEGGILKMEPLRVGDSIVLPSGVYHSFSAAPGVFASYGAIEFCNDPKFMYQVHYEEDQRDPRHVIANSIAKATGMRPRDVSRLTLADIPGFEPYVEQRL